MEVTINKRKLKTLSRENATTVIGTVRFGQTFKNTQEFENSLGLAHDILTSKAMLEKALSQDSTSYRRLRKLQENLMDFYTSFQ